MLYIRGVSPIAGLKFSIITYNNYLFICYYINRLYKFILPYKFKTLDNINSNQFIIHYNNSLFTINYIYNFINTCGRIVFKGKGYRVRIFKKNKKITLNFGHSHWTKLKAYKNWSFFKLRRQSYVFFGVNYLHFLKFSKELSLVRIMNRYTQRGLRMKKQSIKKRFGKISQYISSLH